MSEAWENNVSTDGLPQMDLAALGGKGWDPLHELMRAIILRTIEDYQAGGEEHEDAVNYMNCDDDEYIFSFRSICSQLGFDPGETRHYILNAQARIKTRRRAA